MQKISYKVTLAAASSLLAFGGASVLAAPSNNAHAADAVPTATAMATDHGKPANAGKPAGAGSGHLADAQLKSCQQREAAMNNITSRIIDRGTKQSDVFVTIATRTEDFYTKQGKTVAGYDALVKAVTDAKAKTADDLAALKTDATIDCTGTDPKGMAASFQDNLKQEIADLKAEQTAVKNLIVAVKSVDGQSVSGTKPSMSPKASESPEPSETPEPSDTPEPTKAPKATN